jgi:hypothetical protein
MSVIAWILSRIVWLFLLLLGLFVVLMKIAVDVMHGEVGTDHLGMALFFGGLIPLSLAMLISPTSWRLRHVVGDPKARLLITRSWYVSAGQLLGALLMGSACAYALAVADADDSSNGLASAGLLIFVGFIVGIVLAHSTMVLTLAPEGLDFRGFRCGPIAWTDISAVEVRRVFRTYVVNLQLRDEQKYVQRGFKRLGHRWLWTRVFNPSPFSLPGAMFDVSPDWLRRAIQVRLDHFGVASRPPIVQRQGTAA